MATQFDLIEREASKLTSEERARLALKLIHSLDPAEPGDVESAWIAEVDRRIAAYEGGEVAAIPAEEVLAQARRLMRG